MRQNTHDGVISYKLQILMWFIGEQPPKDCKIECRGRLLHGDIAG